jgi:hypothetical protein
MELLERDRRDDDAAAVVGEHLDHRRECHRRYPVPEIC